jgi:Na+/H+ antiporter NhaD/arsenite permease-like protein
MPPLFAAAGPALDLHIWSVTPFVVLLLAVALLPLVAEHWWHHNRSKALVVTVLLVPTTAYLLFMELNAGQATLAVLGHEIGKYISFILLLGSLYIVSGGIVIVGAQAPTPRTNTMILGLGCALANLIGTTGASVLLIRPLLRINKERQHSRHVPVFFIFTVSNLGGLLTPLGDPPLFLGFLHNVPFFWTLKLWPEWLLVNGSVLTVFFIWDTLALRRELTTQSPIPAALNLQGWVNLPLLGGIIVGVLLQGVWPAPWGEIGGGCIMAVMAGLSLWLTPASLRRANAFTWDPILEVAILFVGIFVTMVPALAILEANHDAFGLTEPWQFFWLTGILSAFLDNAPTYLTFATMAAGSPDFLHLVNNTAAGLDGVHVLQAISCGAVFMGALTYIGNGPNFMVKAIADQAGYKMPSFFGYMGWACAVLLPVLCLISVVFF